MNYEGILTAMVTPLTKDNLVDEKKLVDLIEFQLSNGITGLLMGGGTGEYAAVAPAERAKAVKIAKEAAAGRVPVIAGVLDPGLGDSIHAAQLYKKAGADSLLLLTPFYVSPSQEGIYDYFKKLDEAVDMPFMIYNIPYRTMINITPDTVERMADTMPNLCGMKECSPNLGQAIDLLNRVGDRIAVLSGEEFLCAGEVLMGAKGGIIATANVIPDVWVRIYEAAKNARMEEVRTLMKQYFPFFQVMFREPNPGPIKYAMKKIGKDPGVLSTPLREPGEALQKEIDAELKKIGLL